MTSSRKRSASADRRMSKRLRSRSSAADTDTVVATDPKTIPTYYAASTADSTRHTRLEAESGKDKMCDLLIANEALLDELYHLKNFTSLVYFDPSKARSVRSSDAFQQFEKKWKLWPDSDESSRRVSSRIRENTNPLQAELTQMIEERRRQKLVEKKPKKAQKIQKRAVIRRPAQVKEKPKEVKVKKVEDEDEDDVVLEEEKVAEEPEPDSDSETDPDSIPSLPDDYHLPKKVHLNVGVKPQIITHPIHVTRPKFASLDDYFNSYRSTMDETVGDLPPAEYEEYLKSQEKLVGKIRDALRRKVLKLDFKENVFRNVPNGTREPTMVKPNFEQNISHYRARPSPFRMRGELTHYDHLLAQGVKSSKLIHHMRTSKMQRGRKIAQMVENHFRRQSQEKERKEKEFHRHRVRLARDTAREVKKKWLVAVKAFKILDEKEKEKERAIESKKQLSKILDQSTKVLGAQLTRRSASPATEKEEFQAESEEENDGDDYFSSDSSSSEGEEAAGPEEITGDDDKLTPEQLRKKYGKLSEMKLDMASGSEADSDDDSEMDSDSDSESESASGSASEADTGLAGFYSGKVGDIKVETPPVGEITEREKELMEESADSVLSEDSESSSLDSGSEEEEAQDGPGLKSLFGNNLAESDDDSVYSEKGKEDTPTSSPDNAVAKDDYTSIPDVPVPSLLRGTLRPYQKQGLNWLASLYNNGTNGILADEMGLGKTIQTISLLSYLACERNEWGPHLIVVPTSVMLNWEMEFKRFAPGFKVLTYYGSPQQRKEKRKGWNTPDTFHVCITSYQLVVQDHPVFRRKKWQYMILDEAHNIKNFRSQRWQTLLNFNTEHRLLLTGTPLQNNIVELWSLLYFLMPSSNNSRTMPEGFADLMNFQQWFGKPVDKIIQGGGLGNDRETKETVDKLHQVLRPYLLRRLKQDVEKQLPAKYEHIVSCRLSKRQRLLYDDFMSRAQTKETLASGNFLSIINCLMQLRKVCNHPDLFEVRPINTSLALPKCVPSEFLLKELVVRRNLRENAPLKSVDLDFVNMVPTGQVSQSTHTLDSIHRLSASKQFEERIDEMTTKLTNLKADPNFSDLEGYYKWLIYSQEKALLERTKQALYINNNNCSRPQWVSSNMVDLLTVNRYSQQNMEQLHELRIVKTIDLRAKQMHPEIANFAVVTPKAAAQDMVELSIPPALRQQVEYKVQNDVISNPFHEVQIRSSIAFPDKSLLQYDCGKLQKLAILLQQLIPKGHRVLIFTQMSKVLDILEKFLNYNGYTYMRLDGSTKIEDRQLMTERFNRDNRVNCFILSTRSGGLGINLTGADTVVFYDSDWNPAMDKQCQDRCHRIGQTRDVHIYRFVSEYTIESNILKKANQKRQLDSVVIQEGDFTTDYFSHITVSDLLGGDSSGGGGNDAGDDRVIFKSGRGGELTKALENAEDAEDAAAAKEAMKEVDIDEQDFDDEESHRSSTVGTPRSDPVVAESEEMARRLATRKKDGEDEDDDSSEEDDDDDGIGHVDEYMIRFIAGGFYFD